MPPHPMGMTLIARSPMTGNPNAMSVCTGIGVYRTGSKPAEEQDTQRSANKDFKSFHSIVIRSLTNGFLLFECG
ncbi:hypothetical protein SAMN04487894_104286 [Niabella drilacis]|uniref:Uncharacterized protein n=1 Tax=Niabella drilacis (strain DSM 25811 / CCM 8410 / CCUG 62505 / LMG 26954 / E90) TaxID=1285928 RepID=A0A1G6Q5S0_NIADE|nr:hypothetical protein SAMN04487894_104286 [Niabella drilacis]